MIKVAATSKTVGVAGAIAHTMRKSNETKMRAIGAGAVNQAIKAIAVARKYLLEDENPISIHCIPAFVELDLDGEEKTAVEVTIKRDEFVDGLPEQDEFTNDDAFADDLLEE